ncbi:hypothetical protein [Agromyces indicus]|uniref:Uncharacterized protein n=1 Tax=Agromyces indicus TaxID=758919 RepID=A0ABU1FKS8_9MICO|nr:hypothetical protein [Agromyces indicus]MDR5691890.1 hypothetical protein [Agromyces indicus]
MNDVDVELLDGECLMTDADELIFRQITDRMIDGDKINTEAFGPQTIDNGMPSFSRSSIVSAQEARDWHTLNARRPSVAVYAVTVGEVIDGGRHTVDDAGAPAEPGSVRAPGHCFVDYRGLNRQRRKELRAHLYMCAMRRREIPTRATTPVSQLTFGNRDNTTDNTRR